MLAIGSSSPSAPGQALAEGVSGTRFPVTVLVGAAVWANFHVDIVGESVVMTGTPDDVPPLISITLRGLDRPGYRAYPLVDHIAD
jgi:hypothetical protein